MASRGAPASNLLASTPLRRRLRRLGLRQPWLLTAHSMFLLLTTWVLGPPVHLHIVHRRPSLHYRVPSMHLRQSSAVLGRRNSDLIVFLPTPTQQTTISLSATLQTTIKTSRLLTRGLGPSFNFFNLWELNSLLLILTLASASSQREGDTSPTPRAPLSGSRNLSCLLMFINRRDSSTWMILGLLLQRSMATMFIKWVVGTSALTRALLSCSLALIRISLPCGNLMGRPTGVLSPLRVNNLVNPPSRPLLTT